MASPLTSFAALAPAEQEILHFLRDAIGLNTESVGCDMLLQASQRRQHQCNVHGSAYVALLRQDPAEQKRLVESVLVLETWFFRNHQAFLYLARIAREWLARSAPAEILRVFSVPCATGEEPYSIVMTLLDAGIPLQRFQVDAMDISEHGLAVARTGEYFSAAFRGNMERSFQQRYFSIVRNELGMDVYRIHAEIRQAVRFTQANLLTHRWLESACYPIVFCRNLLIYFTENAKNLAQAKLRQLLAPEGILFLGHAERGLICGEPFEQVREPGVFACRLKKRKSLPLPLPTVLALPVDKIAPLPVAAVPPKQIEIAPLAEQDTAEPPASYALLELARKLADQGQLLAASAHCNEYLAQNPNDGEAHFLNGLILQAQGKNTEAEVSFNRALYLCPEHIEALHHLTLMVELRDGPQAAVRLRQRLQRLRVRVG